MKIKIIANNPPEGTDSSDISKFIGQEFEVKTQWNDNAVDVDLNGDGYTFTIFEGEYEIIEQ